MASDFRCCMLSYLLPKTLPYLAVANFLFLLAFLPVKTNSLSFNFPSFDNNPGVDLQGHAFVSNSQIQLTRNQIDGAVNESYGRALYPKGIQLWDASTKKMTDFTTNFTFSIAQATTNTAYGDGLTFLLVPESTLIPNGSYGGCLGLFSVNGTKNGCVIDQTVVAVEFDTYKNSWDPSSDHIGIDVNSIKSAAYVNVSVGLKNKTAQAFVSYSSTTKSLSVILSMKESPDPISVSHTIDLSTVLPQRIQVGFSAGTGTRVELHKILAWSFDSTLEDTPPPSTKKGKGGLVGGVAVGIILILVVGIAIAWIRLRRKTPGEENMEDALFDIDEDFDKEAGPRRFAYSQLSRATNNFAIEGKLGEGGFGGVYKGLLTGQGSREIAVKKIKSGSKTPELGPTPRLVP